MMPPHFQTPTLSVRIQFATQTRFSATGAENEPDSFARFHEGVNKFRQFRRWRAMTYTREKFSAAFAPFRYLLTTTAAIL
jgi:hypothetical protein